MTNASRSPAPTPDTAPTVRRAAGISLFTATCLVVANMIGTGVFTSLGFQVGSLPSGFPILLLWVVGGVSALCGALAYGELASTLPRSGGEYHFLSVIFHPAVGFLAGWVSISAGFAAPIALAAMAFGRYGHAVFPALAPLPLSLGVVALVTTIHLGGVGFGSIFQNAATVLKVTLVGVLIAAGVVFANPQPLSFFPVPGDAALVASAPFAVSLVYVMYAYSGWNAAIYIVGEIRRPERNVPLAIALGTVLVTVLYVAVNAVFLRTTPLAAIQALEHKEDVAYVAAQAIFGAAGARRMAGLICVGLISSISAMTWVGPRVALTMGEDFRALRWLARTTRAGVPAVALLVQGAIVVALLWGQSFSAVLTYTQFSLTLCSFLAVLGVIILRVRRPELRRPAPMWGYPVTPLLFLAVNGWMLVHILRSNPRESLAGFGTLLLGLAIFFGSRPRAGHAAEGR